MAVTGFFHHIGTFFLFVATILLLITTITSPVVNDISMLRVHLTNKTSHSTSAVSFGTFGFCVLNVAHPNDDDDYCTKKIIGYNPLKEMAAIESTPFNDAAENTSKALTRVMVLHPVAAGLSFIAFLLALGSGFIGAIFAALVASLAFIVTLVVMACDFVLFGIVKNKVNDSKSASHAEFSTGMWTILAAMILLFLGVVVVLLTCCSSRLHAKRNNVSKHADAGYGHTTTTRRHFWQRRTRY